MNCAYCFLGVDIFGCFQNVLIDDLKRENYKVTKFTGTDPRISDSDVSFHHIITTHYILQSRGSKFAFVHVVVFFEREDFLWHAPIPATKLTDFQRSHLTFGETAGAYDMFVNFCIFSLCFDYFY